MENISSSSIVDKTLLVHGIILVEYLSRISITISKIGVDMNLVFLAFNK